jgi:23S rRNA (guanine1835-N2)-methyltransferase
MTNPSEQLLKVKLGEFTLQRLPKRPLELLQAWDAADEYLLDTVAETLPSLTEPRILIVNDNFGALAVALSSLQPQAFSDSYLSQQATRLNLIENGISLQQVQLINSLEPLQGVFDIVLIKAPKTLALLEDQLIRIHPHLNPNSQVILAGMIKALPSALWTMLERLIGPTTTSLARKKARLISARPDMNKALFTNPYPVYYTLENSDYLISNHANVFSRERLDIGTRFFLEHLPIKPAIRDIIDLGCGNGLLGLMAAERNPLATLHFVDESFMAVASAKDNFSRAFELNRPATFTVGDGLCDFEASSADLILCNPPFHQQHTVGDQIAVSLFVQSRRILRKGGELWVIGNRHLNYHSQLQRLFGNHHVIAANAKFIIIKAVVKS